MSTVNSLAGSRKTGALEAQRLLFKDDVLEQQADIANVAQFVSFGPLLEQRHARIHGYAAGFEFDSVAAAVGALLTNSPDGSVNIRSYDPATPESREFVYGLREVEPVIAKLRELAASGLYTIVNETVDVNDGGVSGVVMGDIIEFAPGDTPRAVEKPGIASLPRDLGLRLLTTVYGFEPALNYPRTWRVEFSIHPNRRGVQHDHTIIWQAEDVGEHPHQAALAWPNRFSQFVGDKTFGLLVAEAIGVSVPRARVLPRWLPPFEFGRSTGTGETWIRTCPTEQQPGHFTTASRWLDPFALLQREDPEGKAIAAVLAQDGVAAEYSGALVADQTGVPIIEGVRGQGDKFMVGQDAPMPLPTDVERRVAALYHELAQSIGPVRMEWVFDGRDVWVVQMHRGATTTEGDFIVPGDAPVYRQFFVTEGIEAFRAAVVEAQVRGEGIALVGHIGITSHFGDILRRMRVPSFIMRPELPE